MSAQKKSSLGEMHDSIRRLKEKTELLAAQTVMARANEEEPETESQRILEAHARFRTAVVTTTAKMAYNAECIRRRIRRRARVEIDPMQTIVEEAVADAENDAPAETESEG